MWYQSQSQDKKNIISVFLLHTVSGQDQRCTESELSTQKIPTIHFQTPNSFLASIYCKSNFC